MLIYAIFTTFILGMIAGAVLVIVVAIHSEERDKAKADAKRRHPSSRAKTPFEADILSYD